MNVAFMKIRTEIRTQMHVFDAVTNEFKILNLSMTKSKGEIK